MPLSQRRYGPPECPLDRVHDASARGELYITRKARAEAEASFPPDLVDVGHEIEVIVSDLQDSEYTCSDFREEKDGWVDVYKVDFEGMDYWVKIKLECDEETAVERVIVISFHQWDESRPL